MTRNTLGSWLLGGEPETSRRLGRESLGLVTLMGFEEVPGAAGSLGVLQRDLDFSPSFGSLGVSNCLWPWARQSPAAVCGARWSWSFAFCGFGTAA